MDAQAFEATCDKRGRRCRKNQIESGMDSVNDGEL